MTRGHVSDILAVLKRFVEMVQRYPWAASGGIVRRVYVEGIDECEKLGDPKVAGFLLQFPHLLGKLSPYGSCVVCAHFDFYLSNWLGYWVLCGALHFLRKTKLE